MQQLKILRTLVWTLICAVAVTQAVAAGGGENWTDLGNGLAGTHGAPVLSGDGPLMANTTVTLSLADARAEATSFWAIGLAAIDLPFKGGVFVPAPDLLFVAPTGGSAGLPASIDIQGGVPSGIPDGTQIYFQCWIADTAGPAGFAASNGLVVTATQLYDELSEELDALLAVADPPATSMPIYTSQDFGTQTYVRNPDCWAADIDLTGLSPWNALEANRRAGTLVSPRHIVFAAHYQITPGSQIVFVTADNTTVTRTLGGVLLPGGDTAIGILDSDVPPEIGFHKIMPRNWADYLWELSRLPMLHLDQEEKALVRDLTSLNESIKISTHTTPIDPLRASFAETLIGGDSGNPAFLIMDGEAVLILTHHTAGSGPFYTAWFDEMNAAMTSLGGGYQLTEFDIGAWVQP